MSLPRYLLIVFLGFCFYFLAVVWLLGGPQAALGDEAAHMWWRTPIMAAAMTGVMSKWARETPPDERHSLHSYRSSNVMLACIVGATFIALLMM
jgi:hypothetical protein